MALIRLVNAKKILFGTDYPCRITLEQASSLARVLDPRRCIFNERANVLQ